MARRDKARREQGKARQCKTNQTRQGKARQHKTQEQDTKTRHDNTLRQARQDTTRPPRRHDDTDHHQGPNRNCQLFLPVLFFKSYILIQILVLSGYYNIGTKDRSQKLGPSSQKSPIYVALCITSFS